MNRIMMKKEIIVILGLLFSFLAQAQESQDTLTIDLALCRKMSLENSELIKIADATIQKAESQQQAARSAYLPNVSASAMAMYSEQEISETLTLPTMVLDASTGQLVPNLATDNTGQPIIGADGNPVFNSYAYLPLDLRTRGGMTAGVKAEQALYAGGKIAAGNAMATIGLSLASDNKELKRAALLYETDQAYYTYISVLEKVKLTTQSKALLDSLYLFVTNSYELGMAKKNDVLKVKVKLNDIILQKQKAESGLTLSRMNLCRTIGVPYSTNIALSHGGEQINMENIDMGSVDVTSRLEYQMLNDQVKLAEEKVKMTRADYLPMAGVSVGYNYYNIDLKDADNYDNAGLNVVAQVKIPITSFGERKGKVKAEKSELAIKQYELERASELLTLEIEQARLNWTDAKLRVGLAGEALEQAAENLSVSQDNYELGLETIVNLMEAQTSWQKAYSSKIDAETDLALKASYFLKVTNRL